MKIDRLIWILVICFGSNLTAQSLDYNTKKGVAIAGYDVVSYFNDSPMIGSDNYITEYDGVIYKFSSDTNRQKFISNPEAYLPQYGGYCAYAMAVSAKKVSVNPETFEVRDSKLYLFYNSGRNNTLKSWLDESPAELRSQADTNWEKVKLLRR